jgi:hypothetical protein
MVAEKRVNSSSEASLLLDTLHQPSSGEGPDRTYAEDLGTTIVDNRSYLFVHSFARLLHEIKDCKYRKLIDPHGTYFGTATKTVSRYSELLVAAKSPAETTSAIDLTERLPLMYQQHQPNIAS